LSISILKNTKNSEVLGVDLSFDALEICNKNIESHNLENRFKTLQSDLFLEISEQKFDFLISNPPYIKTKDIDFLQDEVRIYEPKSALDGGNDGLDFYREIAKNAREFLNENGIVILEIGFDQKEAVTAIFLAQGFKFDDAGKDLSGRDRVLVFCA
jgi:release factor glutamine methyltransferase